jgi:hypothetical protein
MIVNGNIVNGSTINTHASSTIFLRNQNNRTGTRTKAFSYIPVVQKLLDLSLNFLSLFCIGPICYAVWQHCSRDQVDLMFNSSQRWQSRGISAGKTSLNSCKRLLIARGKCIVISSSKNKTCLHTKA